MTHVLLYRAEALFIYPIFVGSPPSLSISGESGHFIFFFLPFLQSMHINVFVLLMSFFLTYFIYAKLTKRWAGDGVYMQFVNRNCTAVRFKVHKKYNFEE